MIRDKCGKGQSDMFYSTNKENFLLPLISMKRLRSNNLVNTLARNNEAQLQRADAISADKGNCYRDFLRSQMKLWEVSETFCNVSDIRSIETRRASIRHVYRIQSSSTTLGRRHVTPKSRTRWTTAALDRIASRRAAISKDVGRISTCSTSRWTGN